MATIADATNITGYVVNTPNSSSTSGSGNTNSQFSDILGASVGSLTDAQVSAALAANPNATPLQIYNFMKQSGVDINQLSRVSGTSVSSLANSAHTAGLTDNMLSQIGYASPTWTSPIKATQSDAYSLLGTATAPSQTGATDTQVEQWLAANPNANAAQVMGAAAQHGVTLDQLSRVYGVVPNILIQDAAQQGVNVAAYTNSDLGWKSVAMDTNTFACRLADVGPAQLPGLLQAAGIANATPMSKMYGDQASGGAQSAPEGSIYWANQMLSTLTPTQSRALQDTYYAWANQQTQQNTNGKVSGLFGNEYLTVANTA